MKILILNSRSDFRITSFITPFKSIENIGIMSEFNENAYNEYKPDFVMSDDMSKTPGAYDLSRVATFAPFINLDTFREPQLLSKYTSDVSYIGRIEDFDSALLKLLQLGYNVKHFLEKASTLTCYSGNIDMSECYNVYRNCKVCPIPKDDLGHRELDIIVAGGNPLRFKDVDGFIAQAIKGIEGKKFRHLLSKSEILTNHTNYDRLATELSKIGQKTMAQKILDRKKICLE
jgi:hypothetical protein